MQNRSVGMDSMEELMAAMTVDYVEHEIEKVETILGLLNDFGDGNVGNESSLQEIIRMTHSIKGQGGTFGFPNISLIAHRAEDFIGAKRGRINSGDLRVFYDLMADIFQGKLPKEGKEKTILEKLPPPDIHDLGSLKALEIEINLVIEKGTVAQIIRAELQEGCGYPVVVLNSTVQALEYAVRVQPDLMIISASMPMMSGMDLIRALKTISGTRTLRTALLTANDQDPEIRRQLPPDVPIISKSQRFGDTLAAALIQLDIV